MEQSKQRQAVGCCEILERTVQVTFGHSVHDDHARAGVRSTSATSPVCQPKFKSRVPRCKDVKPCKAIEHDRESTRPCQRCPPYPQAQGRTTSLLHRKKHAIHGDDIHGKQTNPATSKTTEAAAKPCPRAAARPAKAHFPSLSSRQHAAAALPNPHGTDQTLTYCKCIHTMAAGKQTPGMEKR
jgi:hypothetical protein